MDVLIVSLKRDFANVSYTLEQCLREVGVDALALVLKPTIRAKSACAKLVTLRKLRDCVKEAKIILFMHSVYIDLGIKKNQRIFVYHGGGRYRENYDRLNKVFNPKVEKSIIQTGDLFGLGAKNEVWLLPAADTKKIKPVYERQSDKIIVGHFPSSPAVKSSNLINKVMKNLKKEFGNKFEYVYSSQVINWNKNIDRVSKCDIYIDACTPMLQGKKTINKYGEWGVASIEAAALGKIVVTHFLSYKRYEREYGKCDLVIANSMSEVENQMRKLLSLNNDNLLALKKNTRAWVEKFHSYYAVGKRLKEKVYNI